MCIIAGIATSVYFYSAIGERKRRDRESTFSNCIERNSPARTSSPAAQSGMYEWQMIVFIS